MNTNTLPQPTVPRSTPAHRHLKLGVIGIGGRGRIATTAHQPDNGIELVAGVDPVPRVRTAFAEKFPSAFITADYRDLLARADIDAVFITSPDYFHEEQTVAALDAGKSVYLEKPMAITIAGCDRILATARRTGQKLYVGHNMRHFPVMRKMKELIDDGAIGEPKVAWCRHFVGYGGDAYFKDWHADRRNTTGLLLQKGAHDIDILHWLCGGYTQTVTAMGGLTLYNQIADRHPPAERGDPSFHVTNWPPLSQKGLNPVLDVEDVSLMLMQLDNGIFASYQQCHYTPDTWRNYTVIGTAGRIENDGDMPGNATVRLWNTRCDKRTDANEQFVIPAETGTHGGADPRIVAEFIRYLCDGGQTETSPVAARYAVATGCAATESLRSGSQPQAVPALSRDLTQYFAQ